MNGGAGPRAARPKGSCRSTGGAVVLIGMPGAGKSTVGVRLAKRLGLSFVDTDILIQERAGRRLQQILEEAGYRELRRLEEEAILSLAAGGVVIATGGSAVYSESAMRHLGELGTIVYLSAGCDLLAGRIDDYERRGIANPREQHFEGIYRERAPMYARYADLVVAVDGLTPEGVARAVITKIRGSSS
ncbi:MAG: shikimate kinase [Candidatus Methylomirabilia bacterium]